MEELMTGAEEAFLSAIHRDIPLDRSYLLRYESFIPRLPGVPRPTLKELERCSAGEEGMRWLELGRHNGVEFAVLDLSSSSRTGTVKAASGCFIAAACLHEGVRDLAVLSSGNKSTSVRAYALRQGISVISFVPKESAGKLRDLPERGTGARDVIVLLEAGSDEELKAYGRRSASRMGIHCQPILSYYESVDQLRAAAYAESLQQRPAATHFFQAVSSNYGLYGTYRGLEALTQAGAFRGPYPVPVGVQQAALSPLHDIFENGAGTREAFRKAERGYRSPDMFERTLFTTSPATVAENRWLKERFGARFTVVSRDDLARRYGLARRLLGSAGIAIPEVPAALEEKTGGLCLSSALQLADEGLLKSGERVVVHFTGGVERLSPFTGRGATVVPWSASRPEAELEQELRRLLP